MTNDPEKTSAKRETYLDRIKHIKTQRKITNEDLSAMTGIPLGTLSKLLAGINDAPRLPSMIAISQALGCSMDYLLFGIPENKNNFTLDQEEMDLIGHYRATDAYGRALARSVLQMEEDRARCQRSEQSIAIRQAERAVLQLSGRRRSGRGRPRRIPEQAMQTADPQTLLLNPVETSSGDMDTGRSALLPPLSDEAMERGSETLHRSILLYDLPVSAGPGEFLSEDSATPIYIPDDPRTVGADIALRIAGDSMEPEYRSGDILLVSRADCLERGELGIFLLDGCGYFKQFGGDRLISLNPAYEPILLHDHASFVCCGRVVGRMRRKES